MRKSISLLASVITSIGLILSLSKVSRAQLHLTGNQTATISTGTTYPSASTSDTSHLIVNGGTISGELNMRHSSRVDINSGSVGAIISEGSATINIAGGNVSNFIAAGPNSITITGGSIGQLGIESQVNHATISGGVSQFTYTGKGDLHVYGGTHEELNSFLTGNLYIYGSDLSLSAPEPAIRNVGQNIYHGNYYTLTGKLTNNSSVGTYRLFDAITQTKTATGIVNDATGQFILVSVPEPATLVLLLLGGASAFLYRLPRLRRN